MPFGNWKPWPFNSPTLVSQVLSDQDYINRGYIWGNDGKVWYCFLDPDRYRFEIWEKEFQKRWLALLTLNVAAAVALLIVQQWWLFWLTISIPTLPWALLYHYVLTAEDQPAAVVTNGPLNEYPFRATTATMLKSTGIAAAASAIIAGVGAWKTVASVPIPLFGVTLSGGFFTTLTAIGTSLNGAALFLFICGFLSKPYHWVLFPGVSAGMSFRTELSEMRC